MMYNTTTELFKGICDAVREKDGTTDLISHQDIPGRIAAISGERVFDKFLIGKFKIENGIASGFDSIPAFTTIQNFTPVNKRWEIQIKFKPVKIIPYLQNYQALFGSSNSHYNCPAVQINLFTNKIFAGFRTEYGTEGWTVSSECDYTLDTEIYYWIKFIYDGTDYRVYISTDGNSFDEILKIEYEGIIYQDDSPLEIGGLYANNNNWKFYGSIDFKETYIKIDSGI